MQRMPPLKPEEMDEDQKRVVDKIVAGPRKGFYGPFLPLIYSPTLLDRVQELGLHCRYQSSLAPALSELLILISARHWTAQFEWYSHTETAEKAGVPPDAIEAIRLRQEPVLPDPDQDALYRFAQEYYAAGKVGDATFETAVDRFGRRGVVDIVGIMGYYALMSMALNVFEEPLPEGVTPPLAP